MWTSGPGHTQRNPQADGGIYLIKGGRPVEEPAQMVLIKNDPKYNEQWPRPLVPYQRTYGITQPSEIKPIRNDGSQSPHLEAGTPFGQGNVARIERTLSVGKRLVGSQQRAGLK